MECIKKFIQCESRSVDNANNANHANKAYNAVVEEMVWRYTLSEDHGVEWIDPNNNSSRILFSYKRFRYARTGMRRATDVTTGKAVAASGGGFATEPMHVYRVTMGR